MDRGKIGIIPEFGTVGAGSPGMAVSPVIRGHRKAEVKVEKEPNLVEVGSQDFSDFAAERVLRIAGDRK